MPDERDHERELNEFWNALIAGEPEPRGDALDVADRDVIRRLQRAGSASLGGLSARSMWPKVLACITDETGKGQPMPKSATVPVARPSFGPNGRAPEITERWLSPAILEGSRRWPLAQLAAAALLLLTLLGSLIALRSLSTERPPTYLEAVGQAQVDTLLDAAVEGASDTSTLLAVERWTFPAGGKTLTVPSLDGPQWIVAERGAIIATVAGVEHQLAPDASLVIRSGQKLVLGNAGEEEATALRGVATSRFALEDYDRAAIRKETALDTEAHPALPAGSSHVLFERLTLPPGAILRIEPASGRDWIDVVSGQLGLTLVGDVLPAGWESGREREIAANELLPRLNPGNRVSLHNIGEEPLVLLRLRVTPLTEGA